MTKKQTTRVAKKREISEIDLIKEKNKKFKLKLSTVDIKEDFKLIKKVDSHQQKTIPNQNFELNNQDLKFLLEIIANEEEILTGMSATISAEVVQNPIRSPTIGEVLLQTISDEFGDQAAIDDEVQIPSLQPRENSTENNDNNILVESASFFNGYAPNNNMVPVLESVEKSTPEVPTPNNKIGIMRFMPKITVTSLTEYDQVFNPQVKTFINIFSDGCKKNTLMAYMEVFEAGQALARSNGEDLYSITQNLVLDSCLMRYWEQNISDGNPWACKITSKSKIVTLLMRILLILHLNTGGEKKPDEFKELDKPKIKWQDFMSGIYQDITKNPQKYKIDKLIELKKPSFSMLTLSELGTNPEVETFINILSEGCKKNTLMAYMEVFEVGQALAKRSDEDLYSTIQNFFLMSNNNTYMQNCEKNIVDGIPWMTCKIIPSMKIISLLLRVLLILHLNNGGEKKSTKKWQEFMLDIYQDITANPQKYKIDSLIKLKNKDDEGKLVNKGLQNQGFFSLHKTDDFAQSGAKILFMPSDSPQSDSSNTTRSKRKTKQPDRLSLSHN